MLVAEIRNIQRYLRSIVFADAILGKFSVFYGFRNVLRRRPRTTERLIVAERTHFDNLRR